MGFTKPKFGDVAVAYGAYEAYNAWDGMTGAPHPTTAPENTQANAANYVDRFGPGAGNAVSGWYKPDGSNYRIPQSPNYDDMFAGMFEGMAAAMERQAAMQADYMAQMSALQEEQMRMQEEQAKAAQAESAKDASDFTQVNADDTARKQLLRRGLMSTYTRYGNNSSNSQGQPKATTLGG